MRKLEITEEFGVYKLRTGEGLYAQGTTAESVLLVAGKAIGFFADPDAEQVRSNHEMGQLVEALIGEQNSSPVKTGLASLEQS